ncbi:MAG: cytochrome c3 family protein [Magnetococcales bacterium]|nr:cytochrome c3 family protein [Magnetococcales bacterium]
MNTHPHLHRLALLFCLLFLGIPTPSQAAPPKDQACLRCHGMPTLSYRDPATGGLRNLAIDPKTMALSDHKNLSCRDCHAAGFEVYPHFEEARRERLECLNCHQNNQKFPRALFESIERSFTRSIHYQSMQDSFTCFSCHNPHDFRKLSGQTRESLNAMVTRDNGMCRHCHDSPEGIVGRTGRLFSSLSQTHAWLPETERHWSKVRCVECHTGGDSARGSHFILSRNHAVRACEACHSQDSILATKLYRHRTREERRNAGFLHSVVMNDAYVIGMTRNQWLDWGGIALIILTLAGVGAHGLARYLVSRSNHHENHH